jgi:hypothetical protein
MRLVLFFVFCFIQFLLNAQDTIYKRTGEIISAKVLEINIGEISYKRSDLLDGPLFIINKNEIKKIKYVTGTIDSFLVVKEIGKRQILITNPIVSENNNLIRTSIRRGVYLYQGGRISDKKVLFLANEKNKYWKNKEIELNISSSKRKKTLQYVIGNAGLGIGVIGVYGSLIAIASSSGSNDAFSSAIVALASAGIVVSSQIVSFSYKLKRIKNSDKVAELYNIYSKN